MENYLPIRVSVSLCNFLNECYRGDSAQNTGPGHRPSGPDGFCLHCGNPLPRGQEGTECLFGQFLFALNHQVRIRMGRPSSRLASANRDQVIARRDEAISRFIHIAQVPRTEG